MSTTIENGEAGSSVRTKLNTLLAKGDLLSVTAATDLDAIRQYFETYGPGSILRPVAGVQWDGTFDPEAIWEEIPEGTRVIINNLLDLHAHFGTIPDLAVGDIVAWDGVAWAVEDALAGIPYGAACVSIADAAWIYRIDPLATWSYLPGSAVSYNAATPTDWSEEIGGAPRRVSAALDQAIARVKDVEDGLGDAAAKNVGTGSGDVAAGNHGHTDKADLVDGVIPTAQIPALAVVDFLGEVATQAAMLALTGQKGDWCVRTDLSKVAVITGDTPTHLTSWTFLSYPSAPVTSVNSQTGIVVLGYSDVGAAASDHDHDDTYQPVGDYSDSDHTHSGKLVFYKYKSDGIAAGPISIDPLTVPYNCTISKVRCQSDGTCVLDIWRSTGNSAPTNANSITASAPPTVTGGTWSEDSTLTDWTLTLNDGDTLIGNIDSASNATWAKFTLFVTRS